MADDINLTPQMIDRIAARVEERLLGEPAMARIQGTVSLRPFDVRKFAQFVAAYESAQFYNKHLYNRPHYPNFVQHLREMTKVAVSHGDGLFLEFGVATGTTITAIAETCNAPVVGFDSFKGLPEDWREGVPAGAFAAAIPTVPANVSLQIGMIEETLPKFLETAGPATARLIHIDTDLYKAAKFILSTLAPRIDVTVVVFDEFYNYPGWQDHEYRAFTEFQAENAGLFDVEYLGTGGSVAVSALVSRKPLKTGRPG